MVPTRAITIESIKIYSIFKIFLMTKIFSKIVIFLTVMLYILTQLLSQNEGGKFLADNGTLCSPA